MKFKNELELFDWLKDIPEDFDFDSRVFVSRGGVIVGGEQPEGYTDRGSLLDLLFSVYNN
jgi:hypothetical protein